MTTRNSGPGGRIPPDGRAPQPPGVGAQARRHDLERPATPGLHGSDLQQGDVQRLEAAQQVQPIGGKKTQTPNPGARQPAQPGGGAGGGQFNMQVPDALGFASDKLAGTFRGATGAQMDYVDPTPWMPLLKKLVTSPGAGGVLVEAYVEQLSNLINRPAQRTHVVNMGDLDDALEASL